MNFMGKSWEWWLGKFVFDMENGLIYHKTPFRGNCLAFNTDSGRGYKEGVCNGSKVYAHRLIFFIANGYSPKEVDHINGNRSDNRPSNLREVDRKQNSKNKACKSPIVGVGWDKSRGKWRSQVMVDGCAVFLGRFGCFGQAVGARISANEKYNFHKNHGRRLEK